MQESLLSIAFWIGVAISIDLFFGTVGQFSKTHLNWRNWSIPLAFYHIGLLLLGAYALAWLVALDWLRIESIAAFSCLLVALLTIDILYEAAGFGTLPFGLHRLFERFGVDEDSSRRNLKLLAFSLDAGFVGLVYTTTDTSMLIIAPIAGMVVGIAAQLALGINWSLRLLKPKDGVGLTLFNFIGSFCSTTAIATFGVHAYQRWIRIESDLWSAAVTAAAIIGTVYIFLGYFIWREEAK